MVERAQKAARKGRSRFAFGPISSRHGCASERFTGRFEAGTIQSSADRVDSLTLLIPRTDVDYDQTNMPAAYDAGRRYSPAVLALWLDVISRWVPNATVSDILDLGCGTGRYSTALAEHFDARVIAVDPSEKMLAEARKKSAERVGYARAAGGLL